MTPRRQPETESSEADRQPEAVRKPPGMTFTSWVDQRINEATERGAFDDLPGAGQPLPRRSLAEDGQTWLRDYLRREGVSADALLPTPLKLRKEIERLASTVQDLRTEQDVRTVVSDINRRIVEWRRLPLDGPPIVLSLVSSEEMVSRWRAAREAARQAAHQTAAQPEGHGPAPAPDMPRRRWWRRRGH
jgi:hypothetical protein